MPPASASCLPAYRPTSWARKEGGGACPHRMPTSYLYRPVSRGGGTTTSAWKDTWKEMPLLK